MKLFGRLFVGVLVLAGLIFAGRCATTKPATVPAPSASPTPTPTPMSANVGKRASSASIASIPSAPCPLKQVQVNYGWPGVGPGMIPTPGTPTSLQSVIFTCISTGEVMTIRTVSGRLDLATTWPDPFVPDIKATPTLTATRIPATATPPPTSTPAATATPVPTATTVPTPAPTSGPVVFLQTARVGALSFNFTTPAGATVHVFAHVLGADGNSDSFFYSIDGEPVQIFDVAEGKWAPTYQWSELTWRLGPVPVVTARPLTLPAGNHTIVFTYRETGALLDQVVVTTRSVYP